MKRTEPLYVFPESFLRSLCEDLEDAPAKYTRRAVNAIEDMCSRQNAERLRAVELRLQRKAMRKREAEIAKEKAAAKPAAKAAKA